MSTFVRIAHGLLFAAAISSPFALAQSPAKQFFKPNAAALAKSGGSLKAPGVVSDAFPVEFNAEQMLSLIPGEEIALGLPNGTTRTVVFELSQDHGGGIRSWVGYLKDHGNDKRVIVTTGPAGSYGVIDTPEGSYRIVPGNGHDWLVDMNQEQRHVPPIDLGDDMRIPPPGAGGPVTTGNVATYTMAVPGVNRAGFGKVTPTPLAVIDLMVVATKGLADRLGAGLLTRMNFIVTRANTAYADSEVGIDLRLVNVTVVDYTDSGNNGIALDAITPGRAQFDGATFGSIETIRSQVKADMVALMRNGNSFGGSGIAWVGSVSPNPAFMYSVTTGCVAGCESVAIHELGHNMGNFHDRATVAYQAGGTSSYGQGAQPYAFGYAFCKSGALTCNPQLPNGSAGACPAGSQPECSNSDASNFADIMAYFQGTTQKIYKFSNPAINCRATGAGTDGVNRPCGIIDTAVGTSITTGSADTAKSMNTTRTGISAIHTGAGNPPGIVQFTNTSFSGAEAGGSIAFTVGRFNGSGGAVTVAYSTSNGSASAGTDFTATNGTLSWGAGDVANKTITVPVANDGITEGIESFAVTLASPTGGASLGHPLVATGLILEPWPPGGTAPTGFSSAITPTRPWAVVTDSFDPNGGDTASYKSGAFASADQANSSTRYTGTFVPGNVVFAYRVDSYPGQGFFEFLVDDVVITSDSGDSGWKSFSTALTAGNHTLEWRYRKTLPFFCANALPPPPQGAACADRAWIDTVGLPVPGATPVNPPRLVNIATRGRVQTGANVLIAGFTIGGTTPKKVLITARGPSVAVLPSEQPLLMADPRMTLYNAGGPFDSNDDWKTRPDFTQIPADRAPGNDKDAAILATLAPGAYTAIVEGAGGATGLSIVEVFEVEHPDVPLINIATRGRVEPGANVMIAGFTINGDANQTVLVTARGPSVAVLPAEQPLLMADPKMTLFNSGGPFESNDDWQTRPNWSSIPMTQRPGHPKDAAILISLPPGAYTAIVEGAGNTSGIAIVEVFAQ